MQDFEDFDELDFASDSDDEFEDFLRYRAEKNMTVPSGPNTEYKLRKNASKAAKKAAAAAKKAEDDAPGAAAAKKAEDDAPGAAAKDVTPGAAAENSSPSDVKKGAVASAQQQNKNNSENNPPGLLSKDTIEKFTFLKDKPLTKYIRKSLNNVVHRAFLSVMPMASDEVAKKMRRKAEETTQLLAELKQNITETNGEEKKVAQAKYKKLKETWDATMVRPRKTNVKVDGSEERQKMRVRALPTKDGTFRFHNTKSCVPSSSPIEHFAARIADLGIDLS